MEEENKIANYNEILRTELERLQIANTELEKSLGLENRYSEIRANTLAMAEIVKVLTIKVPLI